MLTKEVKAYKILHFDKLNVTIVIKLASKNNYTQRAISHINKSTLIMKNTFLILYILFFNFLCSAQKIKIDNGEVKIEEKTVAYIEGKKPLFTVYNLDKTYSVTLQLKFLANSGFGRR